jgi:hypothetical protein
MKWNVISTLTEIKEIIMYRITKLSGKIYAFEIDSVNDDLDNIVEFLESGGAVLIVNELEDVEYFDLDPEEIEVVE